MDGVPAVPAIIVVVAACVAACTDAWSFTVPNILTLPLLMSGILYHSVMDGRLGFQTSLAGALLAFAVLILPYASGGMGAGDVKLMAGVGAWVGVPTIIYVLLSSCIAAGIYALVLMLMRGSAKELWLQFRLMGLRRGAVGKHFHGEGVESETRRDDRRQRLIPFAAMVALGVLATLVWR